MGLITVARWLPAAGAVFATMVIAGGFEGLSGRKTRMGDFAESVLGVVGRIVCPPDEPPVRRKRKRRKAAK